LTEMLRCDRAHVSRKIRRRILPKKNYRRRMVDLRSLSMQPRIDQYEHYTDIGPAVASAGAAAEWKKASGTYGAIICASASTEREYYRQTERQRDRRRGERAMTC